MKKFRLGGRGPLQERGDVLTLYEGGCVVGNDWQWLAVQNGRHDVLSPQARVA